MTSSTRFLLRRFIPVLSAALLLLPASGGAVSTDISDVPMVVKSSAKPNIMFILDNSGSMEWRSITGTDALAQYSTNAIDFYSSLVNQLYYDPNTVYVPAVDKASFSATNPQGLPMAAANPTSLNGGALNDPYLSTARTDLTKYCWYSTTTPLLVPSDTNCKNPSTGTYTKGPIAFTSYYYEYTGSGTPTPGSSTSYVRRNILASINSYARSNSRTDCGGVVYGPPVSCTYAQEIQNFANWFSYYRTRILTMKTVMGQTFAYVDAAKRVGFSTINNNTGTGNSSGANFLSIGDFNDAKKITWYDRLYKIDPANGTPLQMALKRVGDYYSGSGMGYSGGVGSDDPVQYYCQRNFSILSTDGFWNSNTVTSVGNADITVPSVPTSNLDTPPVTGLTAGAAWPRPYVEGPTASSNSLADVAAYYWIKDLRPAMDNKVPVSVSDKASWQHMTTFTIGLGIDGEKDYREDYQVATSGFYYNVLNGTDNWPEPKADQPSAIDDLWHAAVNGHGRYFSAKSPTVLRDSLRTVLDAMNSGEAATTALGLASTNLSTGTAIYSAKFKSPEWSGDLRRFEIDKDTGLVDTTTPVWSAKAKIDNVTVTADTRRIATYTGTAGAGQGIPFRAASLSAAQLAALNTTTVPTPNGADVLAFLRGDRSLEETVFRARDSRLGDIMNAEAAYVADPLMSYNDTGYAAFKANQSTTMNAATRVPTLFQAANDGMLHAFTASDGKENWAYVPSLLFNGPSKLKDLSDKFYTHRFYVDATPVTADVDFSNTCPDSNCPPPSAPLTTDWRTVLIGGLGKGGRGYYALDITTPTAGNESDAASKVLWEFPNSETAGAQVGLTTPSGTTANGFTMAVNKIGYTYGQPLIVKTQAHGWVALVTSGYNNGSDSGGDGHGYLFVLNVRTGKLLHVFDTQVGDSGATNGPSGLAQLSAFVAEKYLDETVQYVYGGDLFGNVWRFDLNSASVTSWKLKKLTQLVDAAGVRQPVTTHPELAIAPAGGAIRRFIYVGTGMYLGDSDVPGSATPNAHATQTQTMYALVDDLSNPTNDTKVINSSGTLRSKLVQQVLTVDAVVATERDASANLVNYTNSNTKGWYVDLPETGERANTDPVLALGALVFTSNIPVTDVCIPGGKSWLNILDFKTGKMVQGLDSASYYVGDVLSSRPSLAQSGKQTWSLIQGSSGSTITKTGPPSGALDATARVSWREVVLE